MYGHPEIGQRMLALSFLLETRTSTAYMTSLNSWLRWQMTRASACSTVAASLAAAGGAGVCAPWRLGVRVRGTATGSVGGAGIGGAGASGGTVAKGVIAVGVSGSVLVTKQGRQRHRSSFALRRLEADRAP